MMFREELDTKILQKYPIYGPPCRTYWTLEQIRDKTFNTKYSRHVADEIEYQQHKEWSKEFFGSLETYIQQACIDPLEPYIIVRNRFPYKILPTMKHYLLWLKPGFNLTKEQIEWILEKNIFKRERRESSGLVAKWNGRAQYFHCNTLSDIYKSFIRVIFSSLSLKILR